MKPRILFILHLPPPIHGAAMMGKYIHDSHVVNETFQCSYINLTTAANLEDIGKVNIKKILSFIHLLKSIKAEVKKMHPDLVYVTPNAGGNAFIKDFVVIQMLKHMGCKVVAHYHNKGVAKHQDNIIYNFLYRRFFKRLKVILLGESLYYDVAKYISKENCYICPNGIPSSATYSLTEPTNDIPKILFISNLIESKGIITLLDALQILKKRNISFACQFVGGETKDFNAVRLHGEIRKRYLDEICIYKGRLTGKEKEKCISDAAIFTFPTQEDCFPLVLLEAMRQGVACISTPEGAIKDIITPDKTGFIVPKNSPEELADRIEYLVKNPETRLKMGREGFKKFNISFTTEVFEQRLTSIFTNILNTYSNQQGTC